MKTIILYATKHGAAAEIAKRIAAQIDDSVTFDLKNDALPSLADFDCVIIGSSVYAGSFRKEAKAFLAQNADELCKKKLGLFISGFSESEEEKIFKDCMPNELLQAAKAAKVLGGIFDPAKFGFFERLVMRIVTKQSGYTSTINDEKIKKFVEAMKAD